MSKKVDIIVSCYNEEDNIFPFYDEIKKYLNDGKYNYNIVFVNDGSKDKTYEKVIQLVQGSQSSPVQGLSQGSQGSQKINISYINFVHNFGHEAAMCAGLDYSNADYLIFMDVDLQNPPSKIPEILKAFENGADCVLLRRIKYNSATWLKRFTSNSYYMFSKYILMNKNARNVSDFFAIDKNVAEKVKNNYKTTLRFIRSFVQSEAKNIAFVNYENAERHSGTTRYNYVKLTKLAIVSELSRSKILRDKYVATDDNPVYIVDRDKTNYI